MKFNPLWLFLIGGVLVVGLLAGFLVYFLVLKRNSSFPGIGSISSDSGSSSNSPSISPTQTPVPSAPQCASVLTDDGFLEPVCITPEFSCQITQTGEYTDLVFTAQNTEDLTGIWISAEPHLLWNSMITNKGVTPEQHKIIINSLQQNLQPGERLFIRVLTYNAGWDVYLPFKLTNEPNNFSVSWTGTTTPQTYFYLGHFNAMTYLADGNTPFVDTNSVCTA